MSKKDSVASVIQPYKVTPDDIFIQFLRLEDKVVLYNVIFEVDGIEEQSKFFSFVHIFIEDFKAFVLEELKEDFLSRAGYSDDDDPIEVDFADWWVGQDIDVLKKYCQKYIAEGKEIETGTEFTGLSPI